MCLKGPTLMQDGLHEVCSNVSGEAEKARGSTHGESRTAAPAPGSMAPKPMRSMRAAPALAAMPLPAQAPQFTLTPAMPCADVLLTCIPARVLPLKVLE